MNGILKREIHLIAINKLVNWNTQLKMICKKKNASHSGEKSECADKLGLANIN